MQFWAGSADSGEGWVSDGRRAKPLFSSPFTEGTLKYNSLVGWHVFLCQAFDAQVRIAYTGPHGQISNGGGNWTVMPIYEVPEFRRSNGSFSYAAKAHPEMAVGQGNGSQLIFSYNTNIGPGLDSLVKNTWAYHPTFVQLNIE